MEKPPVITNPEGNRKARWAWTLNLLVPGAGQLLLGQKVLGTVLAAAFLIDFSALLFVFLRDFNRYVDIATSGKILEGDNIEQAANAFHGKLLLGLLAIGLVIFVISFVTMARKESPPER